MALDRVTRPFRHAQVKPYGGRRELGGETLPPS